MEQKSLNNIDKKEYSTPEMELVVLDKTAGVICSSCPSIEFCTVYN